MMQISTRLQRIAEKVPEGAVLADIGSDHALLPVYLIQSGLIRSAIAGEINEGPLQSAKRQVLSVGLTDRIDVRSGDGLSVIAPGEADTITIAGMGGNMIVRILEQGKDKLKGVKKLVLQPNVGEHTVRGWLRDNGWFLCEEEIVEDDGVIYEILGAMRQSDDKEADGIYSPRELSGGALLTEELLLLMGPYLTMRPVDAFFRKWHSETAKLTNAANQLSLSDKEQSQRRRVQILEQLHAMREVLSCLQTDSK